MPCVICNLFQGRWKISNAAERSRGLNRNHIVSNLTWDEMRGSAKTCYGCEILISGCLGCFHQHGVRESDILQAVIRFYYPLWDGHMAEGDADKNLTFLLKDGRSFEVELFCTPGDECPVPDSWDYFPVSHRPSSQTNSEAAIATIKGWISDCIINHCPSEKGFCDSPDLPYLPSRVVEVGLANGIMKLIETNGAKGRYVCLSYCWGKGQIITTTRSTLEKRKSGIAWHDLSQTFRDAIWLTRRLGVQYIWIDSLCILQDDSKDWATESAKMSSIYSNGYLTIAATHSENGYGGLFSQTEDFEVCGKTPDGEAYRLFFRERIDHHIELTDSTDIDTRDGKFSVGHPTVAYHPLLTRAWVYQERILSTRVIHFGKYELFFECRSYIICECEGIQSYGMSGSAPRAVVKIEYADAVDDYHSGDKQELYQLERMWRTIVCSYTPLRLTKLKDRLPAIGGLARNVARRRKSRYLAGLWEDTLNDDLLWVVHATSQHKNPRIYPRNAPTWSWASVETWVLYWDEILFLDEDGARNYERPPHEHYSKIETSNVTWSSSAAVDEFGSIECGLLKISGLVARGVLERETEHDRGGEDIIIQHYVRFAGIRLQIKADYLLDYSGPAQTNHGTEVFCLRMSRIQDGSADHLISLILRRSPEHDDLFERIGALVIRARPAPVDSVGEVFEGADLWTVSII